MVTKIKDLRGNPGLPLPALFAKKLSCCVSYCLVEVGDHGIQISIFIYQCSKSCKTTTYSTAAKASKTHGFLRRNLRECTMTVRVATYTSMVRPTFENASSSWDPYMVEDFKRLELVQRRAARFAHNNYHDRQPGCVSEMVQDLNWEPLSSRRRNNRLVMLYKIQRGLVVMAATQIRPSDRRTMGHQQTVTTHSNKQSLQQLLLSAHHSRLESSVNIRHRCTNYRGFPCCPRLCGGGTLITLILLILYIVSNCK